MLTNETIDRARHSQQPMIFLKLDFSKAYDKVDWDFLFAAMAKLGFPESFLSMIRILFRDASNHVNVNGKLTPDFPINRGVRQGCPIAPYLFLIVSEALNSLVKKHVDLGLVKGIVLPFGKQQVLLHYADDTSFTLRGEQESVNHLVSLLQTFCAASGLELNWAKSRAYWTSNGCGKEKPDWCTSLLLA